MNMEMKNGLAGLCVSIDNGSISGAVNPLFPCHASRYHQHMPKEHFVFLLGIIQRSDVFAGNDEHMDRRLSMNILKNHALLILIEDFGRYFSRSDLAENASEQFHPSFPKSIIDQLFNKKWEHI
jgi:hypothetical protein